MILRLVIFVTWPLLVQSMAPAHLLLAALLALLLPRLTRSTPPLHLHRIGRVLRLAGVVAWDIVLSNVVVARQVLGPESQLRPTFVWVPLDLRDGHGIVALASIITLTPGTVSSELSGDRRHLLVHALHCEDEQALVASIKQRYEAPLREIFE